MLELLILGFVGYLVWSARDSLNQQGNGKPLKRGFQQTSKNAEIHTTAVKAQREQEESKPTSRTPVERVATKDQAMTAGKAILEDKALSTTKRIEPSRDKLPDVDLFPKGVTNQAHCKFLNNPTSVEPKFLREFSDMEKIEIYELRTWAFALMRGDIQPLNEHQESLKSVSLRQKKPSTQFELTWSKYLKLRNHS